MNALELKRRRDYSELVAEVNQLSGPAAKKFIASKVRVQDRDWFFAQLVVLWIDDTTQSDFSLMFAPNQFNWFQELQRESAGFIRNILDTMSLTAEEINTVKSLILFRLSVFDKEFEEFADLLAYLVDKP